MSYFRCWPGRAGGVSSGSDNITHAVGERMLELLPVGVTFAGGGGFNNAATRVCCAFAEPDEPAVELGSVLLRGGMTLRFGMRAPKRSSVALRRVWMSCSRRRPLVLVACPLTLAVVNVRRMGAGSFDARFRAVVLLVRAGIPDGDGAGSVLLTFGDAKTGVVVLRGMRGECLTVRGVTVGLRSVRFVAAADCDDLCVALEPSVSVGEGASERVGMSSIGDIGASEDGGVGTTARARRSRSMAISLLASALVSQALL